MDPFDFEMVKIFNYAN